jgi:hypothetical protein
MPVSPDNRESTQSATTARKEQATHEMFDACRMRFPEPAFEVRCDDGGTVWVKRVDVGRSIGLQPWLLRTRTAEEVISRAEHKLGV